MMKYLLNILVACVLVATTAIYLTSCKKEPDPLVLTTASVSAITYLTATSGGNITSEGGSAISAKGVCWSTSHDPTVADSKTEDGSGTGSFTSTLTGLSPETIYYVRAYASNSEGTAYGDELSFTSGQLTDIDGNVYSTIIIGDQLWMKENLKVTRFNDGTDIPYVTDNDTWLQTNDPGYGWYNNDEHWSAPNTDATNESGFTALPGGYRSNGGQFYSIGSRASCYSSSEKDNTYVWRRDMQSNTAEVNRWEGNKNFGYSVRCVKD